MTTARRCAPCQRMGRIQRPQWSGSWACNLLGKNEFRCGWLRWREWDFVGVLLGRSAADRVAATRAHASQAVSERCHCNQNFCPPSTSDTHLQIRREPRSAATWVDVSVKLSYYRTAGCHMYYVDQQHGVPSSIGHDWLDWISLIKFMYQLHVLWMIVILVIQGLP